MIFESQCNNPNNHSFNIGARVIKETDGYTYLGIHFHKTGSLRPAVNNLKDKAQKAWFSTRKTLSGNNFHSAPLMLKVFDTVVRPIATYGAEVWCQDFCSSLKFDSAEVEKSPFEQIHNKACKNILGVRSNGSGKAVKSELGRFPLIIFISQLTVNFCKRICKYPDRLSYDALISEIDLNSNGKKSWVTFWKKLTPDSTPTMHHGVSNITTTLKEKYTAKFFSSIRSEHGTSKLSGNKLRTFAKFKLDYELEKYLNVGLPHYLVRSIAKLRTSTHSLAIETGRYTRPRIPPENRLCKLCNRSAVEDEQHFILECSLYTDLREEMLRAYSEINPLDNLPTNQLEVFRHILGAQNEAQLRALGTFISKSFTRRKVQMGTIR